MAEEREGGGPARVELSAHEPCPFLSPSASSLRRLPEWLLDRVRLDMCLGIRARALKKKAKEAKAQ